MKGLLLAFSFIILFQLSSLSQIYYFKSHKVTIGTGMHTAKSFKKEVIIRIDVNHKSIVIEGEMKNKYKIICADTFYVDLTNSLNYYWRAIDEQGVKCRIDCIIYSKELQSPRNKIWGVFAMEYERKVYGFDLNPN